ncbi:MAG TPA: MarR family transcriptional regulator [Tepidisphaeraceae bacterium]|jgi:DNA-binding MarR family transcriptional regulator|nr:MarR family transcriptional regulator [Tepidisphaeraceae bacterium]
MQLLSGTTESGAPEECAQELLDALPPVMRFLRRHMRCKRRNKSLSVPQFRTLALLGSAPTVNLSAVADVIDTSLPTASRIVSGLVAKGYVKRHESATDRRQIELSLTPRGASTLEAVHATSREKLAQELSVLDAAELKTLSRAMGCLHDIFAPKLRLVEGECQTSSEGRGAGEVK